MALQSVIQELHWPPTWVPGSQVRQWCFPRQGRPGCGSHERPSDGAVLGDQCALVGFLKGHEEGRHRLFHRDVPLQLLTQRSDTCPLQSTRHNVLKPREVSSTVQCQPMGCDVPSTADTCKASHRVLGEILSPPSLQILRNAID